MTDMSTPRERIENYLELCNAMEGGYTPPIEFQKDLRAVLSANAGYERIIREASANAVRMYKESLAAELRHRVATTPSPDHFWAMGMEEIADDLEDGSL